MNFNTGSAHNWCDGAVSNGLTVGISHEGMFYHKELHVYTYMIAGGMTETKGIKQWYIEYCVKSVPFKQHLFVIKKL